MLVAVAKLQSGAQPQSSSFHQDWLPKCHSRERHLGRMEPQLLIYRPWRYAYIRKETRAKLNKK